MRDQGIAQRFQIVTVTVPHLDVETRQPRAERVHRSHRGRAAEALQPVVIDQDRQIGEIVVGGENQRLECRTFLPLAVRGQAEHPAVQFPETGPPMRGPPATAAHGRGCPWKTGPVDRPCAGGWPARRVPS